MMKREGRGDARKQMKSKSLSVSSHNPARRRKNSTSVYRCASGLQRGVFHLSTLGSSIVGLLPCVKRLRLAPSQIKLTLFACGYIAPPPHRGGAVPTPHDVTGCVYISAESVSTPQEPDQDVCKERHLSGEMQR